ncbi:hypothetical protein K504DRAFT_477360 [Pleomassaria siparia CBS 279.74]|uniref:Rhodopsin domain-containing protein n=1 Tax=Pleomassaria siparia CBS 279.74 TaxID=1314801 RepID=A0A6G1K817_9PLEO|nr:hypothetical protein K504DRAFT_477360 [Pleomassaria siparia CBS 279.74]
MVYIDIHLPLPGFIALDWSLMAVALIPILLRLSLRTRNHGLSSLASNIADGLVSINTWKNNLRMNYLHANLSTLYYGVPEALSSDLLYVSWISLFSIYIPLWSTKAAFLAFYYSIFSLQGKRARITLAVACVFTGATFLLHMFFIAFWCSPISLNWSPPGNTCVRPCILFPVTVSTFTNIVTDLVMLYIPISTLLATQLGKTELAGLAFVFLMGSVSILAALVRFVTLKLVQNVPRAEVTHTIDVWALVEIVSSILAVCLPSLRTFVRRHTRGTGGAQRLGSKSSSAKRSLGSECEKRSVNVEESWIDRDEGGRGFYLLKAQQITLKICNCKVIRLPKEESILFALILFLPIKPGFV